MTFFFRIPPLFWLFVFSSVLGLHQLSGQEISRADYQRAHDFLWENINNKKVFNLRLTSDFFPDSTGIWWLDQGAESKNFYRLSFNDFKKEPLFDQDQLADALSTLLKDTISGNQLPFDRVNYISADSLAFAIRGTRYVLDLKTYQVKRRKSERPAWDRMRSTSPDGKWTAYTNDYNLYVKSTESGEVFQLSAEGQKNYEYGTYYGWGDLIEGENGERPEQFTVIWSPDSRYLRTNICDLRNAEKMYLLDYSVDTLFKPRLLSYYRGSPGDTTLIQLTPVFYDLETKEQLPTDLGPRGYVMNYSMWWMEKSPKVIIVDRERGYQKLTYLQLDLETGETETLFSESSTTNIPERVEMRMLEDRDKFVFLSERSGWQHLYSFDLKTRKITPLTSGDYFVHGTVRIDEQNGWVYFVASGVDPEDNPYYEYLYRVNVDGGPVEALSPETGHHNIDFSPDGRFFIDEYSTYEQAPTFLLRESATGAIRAELLKTDISGLEAMGWSPPEAFTAVARDGETIIHGAYWKPTNFDPNRKYPIIDNSYTGPHTHVFPTRFERVLYGGQQDLAELGFIVVRIDGMGTYGRSKAFHDVSYRNMGKNLLDHVLAIRQLGERHAWADTSRVGIFGHSAGGYDAGHAVLEYPDFYKVAVASSADHDFRMEKAWWPEMYMGWPVDSTYHQASNITMAGNLKGKLLITHGGLDENVNPSATFKLAEALIKANKEFDMLILPSQHHGYGGVHSRYFRKKRWNYFVEHLLGAKPIWDLEAQAEK
ncbi:S9 family peptidase [Flavilitoribacter nigricans]|uniref:S9 family peptidase n=1 Tax=Flavilitoribacter nigricans (strain ATCC 23147 / DSM 23189 / NBRC 102662 / NCIMB 1420 / SS-2) TaxID=1122177 RepID=A0A2D0NHL1_FLAN2|nr:DPP IV N-terminal domain-containing protein [Flavilitoribacter nigricans]PHN07985.1 S9 family peptidase [Flavilitoribacter nigricans DSM 23189 = NBRC 102662]